MSETDAERQADEIDSLKWIFPQELTVTSDEPKCGYFKISPHLIEENIIVRVETIVNGKSEHRNVSIRHLSPIELYFILPENYPSASQPLFMVNCVWLSHEKLTDVCRKLDDLWDQNYGCEILFQMVSFLKEELLQYLGINDLIIKLDMDSKTKLSNNENEYNTNTVGDMNRKNLKLRALTNKITPSSRNEKENVSASISTTNYSLNNFAKKNKRKLKHISRDNFKYETPKDVEKKKTDELRTDENSSKQDHDKDDRCRNVVTKTERILRAMPTYGKRPKFTLGDFDSRVIPNSGEQANILNYIVDYNEHRLDTEFRSHTHVCDICFEEKPGWQCVSVKPCRHGFCKDCIVDYLTVNIRTGSVQKLSCLDPECETIFTAYQVKQNVDEATYAKYQKFLQHSIVQSDAKLLFCPRKFCQGVARVSNGREMCHCCQCNFYFCYYCKKTYHGVDMCKIKSDEIMKIVEEYQAASDARKAELEKRFTKSQLVKWVQDDLTDKLLKEVSRPCPNCGALIQKDEGCNKMTCTNCSIPFCWLCNACLSSAQPYAHYQNRDSPCFEKLFPFVNDQDFDWENEIVFEEFPEDDEFDFTYTSDVD